MSELKLFSKLKHHLNEIPKSIYDFVVDGLTLGAQIDFSQFAGKKILIVNTATKCGFTPQLAQLEKLYQRYKDNLVVVGFPSNSFLWQSPGDNEEIQKFCKDNYGISFPMASKISVKGRKMAPIYRWLTSRCLNGFRDSSVTWNFQKYLIDQRGELQAVFNPQTEPLSAEIIEAIEH